MPAKVQANRQVVGELVTGKVVGGCKQDARRLGGGVARYAETLRAALEVIDCDEEMTALE